MVSILSMTVPDALDRSVQNDDVVARLKQLDAGVAADEARAAGYQNFHNDPS